VKNPLRARDGGFSDPRTLPTLCPLSKPTPGAQNDSGAEKPALKPHGKTNQREKKSTKVWHTVRTSKNGTRELRYGRELAIRMKCTECFGWETDPTECTAPLCPLFPFRGLTRKSR
jgi:hypothetical protein